MLSVRPFVVSAAFLLAGVAEAKDLLAVYHLARGHSPELAAADHEQLAVKRKLQQSFAAAGPQFRVEGNWSLNLIDGTNTEDTMKEYPSKNYALTAIAPLFNAEIYYGIGQAREAVSQSEVKLRKKNQEFVVRVAEAYFSSLAAKQGLAVARAKAESLKQSFDKASAQLASGKGTVIEKLDAKARFDLARAEELSARNALASSTQVLQMLTGESIEHLADLDDERFISPFEFSGIDDWVRKTESGNLDTIISHYDVKMAKLEYLRANAAHYPTVSLRGSVGRSEDRNFFFGERENNNNQASMTLQVSVPLFTGFQTYAKAEEARELKRAQQLMLQANQEKALLEINRVYLDVTSGYGKIAALRQSIVSNESALEAMEEGMRAGLRTALDVLDAKQRLFTIKQNYYTAKYQYILDYLHLHFIAGLLNDEILAGLNGFLKE